MVDAVVSFVVERLGDFLIKQVAFIRGVRDEVQWLRDELIAMQRFLKHAEEKQYEDATKYGWVSDIRELAYDIEDLLDTFELKVDSEAEDERETTEEKPKSRCFPSMCSCISRKGKEPLDLYHKGKEQVNLYHMGKEIEEFKKRLTNLSRRRQLYGIQDSSSSREERSSDLLKLKELRKTTSFAVEEDVVGFKDDADQLLAKLVDDEPQRFVISIFGMGGLGKTTLARKLYHSSKVKMKFNRCAWVSVSQDYTTRDLLVRIIMSFRVTDKKLKDLEKMSEADLGRYLHESLQEYSYLLVMDDVWDKEVWKSLKRSFPDNKNGSRVIITTRNQKVAECSDEKTHPHNLRKLREDESWQLFCEKVFVPRNDQLKNLSKEMVKKCDGLPLAIIVLAGLLSRKKPQEWCEVHDHLWQHLKDDSIEIHFLLTLSFDCLPYQLKQCFLYLGLFPEDFEIDVEKLIHLLVAEGFIPQVEDHIMEEVAKAYVDELISRSLIQADKRYWGRIATCRVHDLTRDLAIEKAKVFNFLYIYDEGKHSNILSTSSSCIRQAIHSRVENPLWLKKCNPRLRSLFLFAQGQQVVPMCKKFSSLRVLDDHRYINDEEQSILAGEIEKLIHLKYLGLRNTWFNVSSTSVSKLWRLQTLDMYKSDWPVDLPAEICKLQELRHLIGEFTDRPLQIDNLTKLQTLKYVQGYCWREIKTAKLVNLRELWIVGSGSAFSFDSMSNLKSLRILSVQPDFGDTSFASLQPLSRCQHLMELRLRGKLEKLPRDIHKFLPNLQLLSLRDSQLEDDPMPLLEKLPYLAILHLGQGFYNGKRIMCSDNGFLLLEILLFDEFHFDIEEWQVGKEALPRLRGLGIPEKIKLTIPERLRSLPTPDSDEYNTWPPDEVLEQLRRSSIR